MAGQLPRPWFRLGSTSRPVSAPTAPVPEPRPALIRPPIIRPSFLTEPNSESVSPPQSSAADTKSPPPVGPSSIPALPRPSPATTAKMSNISSSLPASPSKTAESPPSTTSTKPVFRSHSPDSLPQHKAATPPAKAPLTKSSPFSPSTSKQMSSLPNSPSPTNRDAPTNTSFTARPSPAVANSKPNSPSPYQSPKSKSNALPPSPFTLPPSQLQSVGEPKHNDISQEVERKTVVVKKMVDKPAQSDHLTGFHEHKSVNWTNGDQGKEKSMHGKKNSGSEHETNKRVITIAGENRGAFMEIVFSDKSNSHGHRIGPNNTDSENKEDKLCNDKDKSQKSKGNHNLLPMKAFFNNNVQGINNSIMLDSSFTHHDPGIHVILSRKPPSANDIDDGPRN